MIHMDENMQQSNPQSQPTSGADAQDFHDLHPNRKLAIFGIILFFFVISIVVGIMMARRNSQVVDTTDEQGQTQQAGEVKQGETALKLMVEPATPSVGDTVKVTVSLENTAVQATDIAINYDPKLFTASDIVNGTAYDSILKSNIDVAKGQVLVNSSVSASNPQDLRTGDVFSFTLKTLKAGSGKLEFDQDLTITAKNGINTLGLAEPVSITVK